MSWKFFTAQGQQKIQTVQRPVTYSTTLPGSPVDGDEAILVDSTTNPSYQWRFRYNGSSTSSYKWEYVGGTPGYAIVTAVGAGGGESTASDTYTALTTAGPTFTIPRAGDYQISIGFTGGNGNSTCNALMSFDIGATGAVDADKCNATYSASTTSFPSVYRTISKTGMSASTTLTAKYRRDGSAGTGYFWNRWISVVPVRVS